MMRRLLRNSLMRKTDPGVGPDQLELTHDLKEALREIYVEMRKAGGELSLVAFGVLSDYLVKTYHLSYAEAAQLIEEFPNFYRLVKETLPNDTNEGP